MKRLLTLAALTAALALPAGAWEQEAFKALKGIKDMATERAKQEKAEKEKAAREQAAKEQAERDEQERTAREKAEQERADGDPQADTDKAEQIAKERAKWESGDEPPAKRSEMDELREQARKRKERQEREDQAARERGRQEMEALREQQRKRDAEQAERWRQAEQAESERRAEIWAREKAEREREKAERERAEQERKMARQAEREREERERQCNGLKPLADDFSIVEYAQGQGVGTPDDVKGVRERIKACGFEIRTTAGDPSCPHYLFAMSVQESKTQSDRRAALEAESIYEQMKYAKSKGLLSPSDEMKIGKMKKDLREKQKAKNASQRKFEIMYRQADEAGCIADE